MAASAEFKQALRAGKLAEAFAIAMSKTPELEITTWIATPEQTSQSSSTQPQPGHRLRTQINLVAGEIKNEIGDRFIHNDAYQEVHQFHLDQVSRGHQTIKQNLLSLQQMFRLMAVLQDYQQGGEYRELNWSPEAQSLPSEKANSQSPQKSHLTSNPVQLNSASHVNYPELEAHSDRYPTTFISAEEEDEQTKLLSLEDFEVEPEDQSEPQSVEEEWGEWLEEEDSEMAADLLDLDSLELNEADRWDELDNTEFLPNTSARFIDKNQPNSNHQ
ncbi:hypothetical protein STA3757_11010 [Stanieria sp. NIES-3757]|nr:hypothetical protein STA3757_11010 [Stanieria sp. NIES-3757]